MTAGFAKLSSSIVLSTVWREPHPTRIVWITMLALADARGYVGASLPGLADAARVTIAECEEALRAFSSPDPYSRTKAHDGRRVAESDGGWVLLNYGAYRAGRDPETRREQTREATRKWRTKKASPPVSHGEPSVSRGEPSRAQAEAEAEAEAEDRGRGTRKRGPKPATTIPNDWAPTPEHKAFAEKHAVDLDLEITKFRGHWDGQRLKSWNGAFAKWLANAVGFARRDAARQGPQRGAAPVSTSFDGADDSERLGL